MGRRSQCLAGKAHRDEFRVGPSEEDAITIDATDQTRRDELVIEKSQAQVTVIKKEMLAEPGDVEVDDDRNVV